MAGHTLLVTHFRPGVIEGAVGKVGYRGRVPRVATDAIARGRHVVLRLPGGIHPVMTGGTGQPLVDASAIQGGVVEAGGKTAAGLMTILAGIRRRRVRRAFADGFHRIAGRMTTDAGLGLDGRILVVDRIGFLEIARGGVTGIALPTIGVHGGVHRIHGMALGQVDRIVVGPDVAGTATGGVGGMDRIYKRRRSGIATRRRPIKARTVGGVRVTRTAIRRRGNVPRRFGDHDDAVMRFAIVATGALTGDARRAVIKGGHGETGEARAMTDQAILPRRRQRHVGQRPTGRGRSIVARDTGRR